LNAFSKKTFLIIGIFTILNAIFSCSSKTENKYKVNSNTDSTYNLESEEETFEENSYPKEINNEEVNHFSSECLLEDGTYSAIVDYSNSDTGYQTRYTLEVEVEECQVIQINFPNDGYLDEDHISYADIDKNGYANVDGEDGKTYEIQIID
jgi:hypothetical protein